MRFCRWFARGASHAYHFRRTQRKGYSLSKDCKRRGEVADVMYRGTRGILVTQ